MIDLPEGITYNNVNDNQIIIDLVEEIINETKCNSCELHLQAVLITNGSRHSGIIKAVSNNTSIWENVLPKDRTRSINMLNENLVVKLDKHKERHKND